MTIKFMRIYRKSINIRLHIYEVSIARWLKVYYYTKKKTRSSFPSSFTNQVHLVYTNELKEHTLTQRDTQQYIVTY